MRGLLVVSMLVAAFLVIGCTGRPGDAAAEATSTSTPTTRAESSSTTTTTPTSTSTTAPAPDLTTYVVWTSGGLTEGLIAGLGDQFENLSIVTGDAAPLDVGGGRVVPLDGVGLDPASHSPFDPRGLTRSLQPRTVLMGESSAGFRGVDVGDVLTFNGVDFELVGVIPDELIGASEVVFLRSDPDAPVATERYALVQTDLDRAEFESAIEVVNDASVPARVRAEGETPYLRHADGVLPQIFIKLALGEFSYPADPGPKLDQDDEWVTENVVTVDVPILGRITCHRVVVEMVTGAFNELIEAGLESLVETSEYAGCWNPRFIRTVTGTPAGVSRHSWGAALDVNAPSNRLGSESTQDPRLVEIMKKWGFLWGGDWAVTDPMHFEYGVWPDS